MTRGIVRRAAAAAVVMGGAWLVGVGPGAAAGFIGGPNSLPEEAVLLVQYGGGYDDGYRRPSYGYGYDDRRYGAYPPRRGYESYGYPSRRERYRDYYQDRREAQKEYWKAQKDAQKEYWKAQKEYQKKLIKRQLGRD